MRVASAMAVALSLVSASVADQAEASIRKHTEIAAQDLGTALKTFAEARGLAMVYRAEVVSKFNTSGASGELTADEALRALLSGTALTYKFLDEKTVTIVPAATAPALKKEEVERGNIGAQEPWHGFWGRFRLAEADVGTSGVEKEESTKLEEIVVTAQKREERLQDVPISISVLGGEDLDRSAATGITEALNQVPGVAATEFSAQGGGTYVVIRGVSAGNPVFAGSSAVAYYLDAVPFGFTDSAIAPDANAYDMERVEVLRGPQGTLYGASALNGVVRVLTKDADPSKFEFKARSSVSTTEYGGESYRGDLAVNVPLVSDKVGLRAVVGYEDRGGWIDKPNNKDANDTQPLNLRLKLNAQPTAQLSINASAWRSSTDQGAPSIAPEVKETPVVAAEPVSTDYDAYGLKTTYAFAGFLLSSSTSYLDYTNDSLTTLGGDASPAAAVLQTVIEADTFAQEVNLTSTYVGAWRWSVGGIYRDGKNRNIYKLPAFCAPGSPAFCTPVSGSTRSDSFALFGEVTHLFLEGRVELTGGLRYFKDRMTHREDSTFLGPGRGLYAQPEFDNVSPRVVLSWHPDRDLTLYGSYAEGFRSGSAQGPGIPLPPTQPDNLKNYELGMKGNVWDGRLNLNAAAFYTDWRDIQQLTSVLLPGTDDFYVAGLLNGESASGMGFELAATVTPIRGLSLSANVGRNDLTFDADVISGGLVLFAKGSRPNFSPEYTVGASAEYEFPLGSGGYTGRFASSVNRTARQQSRILSGGGATAAVHVGEGDTLTIGRATFSIDSPYRWTVTLFAENLNNETGAVINDYDASPNRSMRIRPRTVGAQFEYRY